MTRFPVTALRSVDLGTPDLARSEAFYTGAWGLEVVARARGAVYLRAGGTDHHVLALHPGERPELRATTFRAASAGDLAAIAAAARGRGVGVLSDPAPNDGPDGGTILALRAPQGGTVRIVHGDAEHAPRDPAGHRPLRLAHVNLNSADVDGTIRFYEAVLGVRLTDRTRAMAFARCNDDHHAVVIADSGLDGLNHVAFLMADLEACMRGAGRVVDHGVPVAWGVGRHGPGDNVFAYFLDPDGIVVEYTAEVLQVDDAYVARGPEAWVWPPGRTDHWGIAPPKAEHVKAAQLAVPHAAVPGDADGRIAPARPPALVGAYAR